MLKFSQILQVSFEIYFSLKQLAVLGSVKQALIKLIMQFQYFLFLIMFKYEYSHTFYFNR